MEQNSPTTERDALIDLAVGDALALEGRHWDLTYSGVDGLRPDTEIPPKSWEQFPRLSVPLGERLLSRESILGHEEASGFVMQIAIDLIWISGFTLVGAEIEHSPHLIAHYLLRGLKVAGTDVERFDTTLLENHNRWSYCAREIHARDEPSPLLYTVAAESTLRIAALVLDLGIAENLFRESFDSTESALS